MHKENRELAKEHRHLGNRLKSIAEDAAITCHLLGRPLPFPVTLPHHYTSTFSDDDGDDDALADCESLEQKLRKDKNSNLTNGMKLYANLRCGAWYVPSHVRDGTCYFKSTDGHYGKWSFSLSRLNLHLLDRFFDEKASPTSHHSAELPIILAQPPPSSEGLIIVDATQQGKRFPDALSKTVPLWSQVINHALYRPLGGGGGMEAKASKEEIKEEDGAAAGEKAEERAKLLESLVPFASSFPPSVPRNEIFSMESLLSTFVTQFLDSGVLSPHMVLRRPLKCFHIASHDADATRQLQDFNIWRRSEEGLKVIPILLVSASGDAELTRPRGGWSYVAGAADDHQSWSRGLDDRMFWAHVEELTDTTHHLDELTSLTDEVVAASAEGDGDAKKTNEVVVSLPSSPLSLSSSSSNVGIKHRSRVQVKWEEDVLIHVNSILLSEAPSTTGGSASAPTTTATTSFPTTPTAPAARCVFRLTTSTSALQHHDYKKVVPSDGSDLEEGKGCKNLSMTLGISLKQFPLGPTEEEDTPISMDTTAANSSSDERRMVEVVELDENAKFGLERSLSPALTFVNTFLLNVHYHQQQQHDDDVVGIATTAEGCEGPAELVIVCGDPSVTAVLLIAVLSLKAVPPHLTLTSSPTSPTSTSNLECITLCSWDLPPPPPSLTATATATTTTENRVEDETSEVKQKTKKPSGHLQAQRKPAWIEAAVNHMNTSTEEKSPNTTAAANTSTTVPPVGMTSSSTSSIVVGAGITKKKIQWAQRYVINRLGDGVFPSRVHMKQLSRYFLTDDSFALQQLPPSPPPPH